MQGGIERAVLDLEDFIGAMLDDVRDGVSVGRTEQERLQDE